MSSAICPYCRGTIDPDDGNHFDCDGCGTPHHSDCYAENGGCTVFGCKCAPADEPKLSVSTPELAAPQSVAPPPGVGPSTATVPAPPPPRPGARPATIEELRQVTNRVVPSMFGSFLEPTDAPAETDTPEPEPAGEPKNRMAFMILGALLGPLGAHNFYAGYKKKAITQLLITVLTLGFGSPMSWIWAIIDICTVNQDSKGVQFAS